jgi:HEAT repeat protein
MRGFAALAPAVLLASTTLAAAQAPTPARSAGAQPEAQRETSITPQQIKEAIDQLGRIDYGIRMSAARRLRRAPAADVVPALIDAVQSHPDGYSRFRSLVLLSGLNDPRTHDVMVRATTDKNDRLRTVAYGYFEHNIDPQLVPRMLDALETEHSEFVRPALTRALAAYASDARVRDALNGLVVKGEDFFRSAVIEAIGDYKGTYALPALTQVAKLDGPLQDDAVLALGKIGDKKSLEVLAALQRSAHRNVQPAIAAAICLLGVNCSSHLSFLDQSLRFGMENSGYEELLRGSANGLAAVAIGGNPDVAAALIERGLPSRDPGRAAIALALGAIALRNTPLMLTVLQKRAEQAPAIALLGEAFDMLEEDLEEERFYVAVRRAYWAAPQDGPIRKIAAALIQTLDF